MKKLKIELLCFLLLSVFWVQAQDNAAASHRIKLTIPDIALVDVESEGNTEINLVLNAPTEGGEAVQVDQAVNNSLWLNYSSLYNQNVAINNGKTRTIYARIVSGTLPPGLILNLQATAASNDGKGQKGTPEGNSVALNTQDQSIIANIGSCYTGSGAGKGHQLNYSIAIDPAGTGLIDSGLDQSLVTIGYTISDN
jgi:hypothetical protein